jgi:hypothetical protein
MIRSMASIAEIPTTPIAPASQTTSPSRRCVASRSTATVRALPAGEAGVDDRWADVVRCTPRRYPPIPARASPKRGIRRPTRSGNPLTRPPRSAHRNPANRPDRLERERRSPRHPLLGIEPNSDGGPAIWGVAASSGPPSWSLRRRSFRPPGKWEDLGAWTTTSSTTLRFRTTPARCAGGAGGRRTARIARSVRGRGRSTSSRPTPPRPR